MELKTDIKREEHRNKIGYIHIGAIQLLIRATFQEGNKFTYGSNIKR